MDAACTPGNAACIMALRRLLSPVTRPVPPTFEVQGHAAGRLVQLKPHGQRAARVQRGLRVSQHAQLLPQLGHRLAPGRRVQQQA